MAGTELRAFWIEPRLPRGPFGLGVTARSLEDAVDILHAVGYGDYLPGNLAGVHVIDGITVAELDQRNVIPNMGPIVVRGMWYPFVAVGVPRWAEERLTVLRHFAVVGNEVSDSSRFHKKSV